MIYPKFNEYWLWITTQDVSLPDTVFVYRIELDAWTVFKFDETPAAGLYHTQSGVRIDDLIGTIDEQNWTLDSSTLDGTIESPFISRESDNKTYVLDNTLNSDYSDGVTAGNPIDFFFTTRDFVFTDRPRLDRSNQLDFESLGKNIDIEYSADYGASFQKPRNVLLDPTYSRKRYWLDRVTDHIRFKFTGDQSDQFFSMRWSQVLGIVREKN